MHDRIRHEFGKTYRQALIRSDMVGFIKWHMRRIHGGNRVHRRISLRHADEREIIPMRARRSLALCVWERIVYADIALNSRAFKGLQLASGSSVTSFALYI